MLFCQIGNHFVCTYDFSFGILEAFFSSKSLKPGLKCRKMTPTKILILQKCCLIHFCRIVNCLVFTDEMSFGTLKSFSNL